MLVLFFINCTIFVVGKLLDGGCFIFSFSTSVSALLKHTRPPSSPLPLAHTASISSLEWFWNQFIRLDLSREKKAYKLIGWVLFSLFVVVLLIMMMPPPLRPSLPLVILIYFCELEIVLCLRLSVSIFTISSKNRTTEKKEQEEKNENKKKELNRNFCSKRVVLSCQWNSQHIVYEETEWKRSGEKWLDVFVLTFDCILYDRLRAE